ncbi:MAG: LPXTG cell wall anchor domain-containing protein [Rhodoglobus sp.]
MFKKALAAAVLATVTALALPFGAVAATPYVELTKISFSTSTLTPYQPFDITFAQAAFAPMENVDATIISDHTATLAVIKTAVQGSVMKQSSDTGAVAFTVSGSAPGSYTLTATGQTSGIVGVATFTIAPADTASGSGLPNTGSEIPPLAIWVGGGALALGAALVLTVTLSRRRSNTAA